MKNNSILFVIKREKENFGIDSYQKELLSLAVLSDRSTVNNDTSNRVSSNLYYGISVPEMLSLLRKLADKYHLKMAFYLTGRRTVAHNKVHYITIVIITKCITSAAGINIIIKY